MQISCIYNSIKNSGATVSPADEIHAIPLVFLLSRAAVITDYMVTRMNVCQLLLKKKYFFYRELCLADSV